MAKQLTIGDILEIIELKQTMTSQQIADKKGYTLSKVKYWLREARIQGLEYPTHKGGRKPIILNQ